MNQEEEILAQLKAVIDPDLHRDIVSLGFVKQVRISSANEVTLDIELTTPACPVKEKFREDCTRLVSQLPWVKGVTVNLTGRQGKPYLEKTGQGMAAVQYIIAVSSCKGGVGKSTIAVNLAFTLAGQGAAVGIFDADVYGPSLPTLVKADFQGLYQKHKMIIPVEYNGVKLMSFAYASANSGGGPAIMRGAMVTQIINQLLTGTNWGKLDYLIIDMPPGTGDIPLTLSQIIPITAAVIVTTPQQLSFVDVEKGIQMFDKMKIPTVAVIENMSYFICPSCTARHELFGSGSMSRLVNQFGITNSFTLPLDPSVSRLSDAGTPMVSEQPDSSISREFTSIAAAVVREIGRIVYGENTKPEITFEPDQGILSRTNGEVKAISPVTLRLACRCAHCVNEMTGERMIGEHDIDQNVIPQSIRAMGNYAVTISWSDGHSSIFPYEYLHQLMV